LQAFRDGDKLLDEIIETRQAGGVESQAQIERAKEIHERLWQLWPELPEWMANLKDEDVVDFMDKSDVERDA
jgi:hypothetical protein